MNISINQRMGFIMRWANMLDRCDNPNSKQYRNYGGRGIKVCHEWYDFFQYVKDLPEGFFDGAQLDRINNDGDYEPSNVKWSTRSENCKNRESTRMLSFAGKTQCASDWAKDLQINISSLIERLDKWSLEDALTKPKGTRLYNKFGAPIKCKTGKQQKKWKTYEFDGKKYTMKELSKVSGIPAKLLRKRINERGWPVDRAVNTPIMEKAQ